MLGYLDFLFLSYSGRIGRLPYWLSTLGLGVAQCGAMGLMVWLAHGTLADLHSDPQAMKAAVLMHVMLPVGIVWLLFLYPTYAVTTKRWHDRDKSGWWSLIAFVPLIGGLWALIELGFLGGTEGANSYGEGLY